MMHTRHLNVREINEFEHGFDVDVMGTDTIKFNGAKIGEVGKPGKVRLTAEMRQRHPFV